MPKVKEQFVDFQLDTLTEMAKRDNALMKILENVTEVRHLIAHTDKGDFSLALTKEGQAKDYRFILDAVPLDAEKKAELLKLFNGVLFTL